MEARKLGREIQIFSNVANAAGSFRTDIKDIDMKRIVLQKLRRPIGVLTAVESSLEITIEIYIK